MSSMSKAAGYIQQLHDARCEGNWDVVPELVRKVRKHAPDKTCLTLTAETECAVEKSSDKTLPADHPSAAANATGDTDVNSYLPKLVTVIDEETGSPEDQFQARVCAGWLHWVAGDYNQVLARLPEGLETDPNPAEAEAQASEWTRVCALKSAYLRANCLARNGNRLEALRVFRSGIPSLSTDWSSQRSRKQMRYWSELFLTEFCMLFSHTLERGESTLDDPNSLASFRSWARYWEVTKGIPIAGGFGFRGSVPRREIWSQYYAALSAIVEDDLPFPTGHIAPTSNEPSARSQLRAELKRVETTYEALLLNETEFPRADEEREEIEEFARLATQNWAVLCGRGWREHDLGPGGREALSRGLLDILYRASMKTYHSTAILRSLFMVHVAVAEFDLAFKAFDSYLELAKKGKARVQKSGHVEPSLDDESTALETISACIATLCRYGHRRAAEKAKDLAAELEEIVSKAPSPTPRDSASPLREDESSVGAVGEKVPPRVIALAWQAVGLANAQWARMTHDSSTRGDTQNKAIAALKKSLSPDLARSGDVRSVFALSVLLAEKRELSPAIELAKTALLLGKSSSAEHDLQNGPHWRERALIPIWHLLSLLLSARQDFVLAARACEGAFEQFQDPAVLFGSHNVFRSDHLNEAEAGQDGGSEFGRGLVDDMDDFEKESVLEVKMTQLALVELLEGPKVAVNASLELLSLFNRLFGSAEPKPAQDTLKVQEIPKSSSGTIRSLRGSIFGRGERAGRPGTRQASAPASEGRPDKSSRPQTMQTVASTGAPTIQVTEENGAMAGGRKRSQSGKRHNSLRKRENSVASRRRASSVGPMAPQATVVDGENYFTPIEGGSGIDFFSQAMKRSPSIGPPVSLTRTFSQTESSASSPRGARLSGDDFSTLPRGSLEYSSKLLPLVQFPRAHEQRRRGTVLVKVWLMIAGFYRRATLYDDAKAAIAEAQRLVQALEAEANKNGAPTSANDVGWANTKSIDELWADVWAEMGNLDVARDVPYSARSDFESALTHFPDHPGAIVGLSNILLDIYSEKLPPPPVVPSLQLVGTSAAGAETVTHSAESAIYPKAAEKPALPSAALGLNAATAAPKVKGRPERGRGNNDHASSPGGVSDTSAAAAAAGEGSELVPPYKATSLPMVDRLAARDRAYAMLSGLTKLGSAWNNSEAWFALARAHEESGQLDKAREVLWWCVELEEGFGVRRWSCVGNGGYLL
ncbi:hypothetical protein RB595_000731 [Gaeumannomyces hyphopodioides]